MIDISKLNEGDKGRVVFYEPAHINGLEAGQIKSWTNNSIFVQYFLRFDNDKKVIKTCGETAAGTSPEDLTFAFSWENKK